MIELLHCDCMEYMKGCEDNAFDLAIVDPPFGIDIARAGAIGGTRKGLNKKWANERVTEHKKSEWDSNTPEPIYFEQLLRISRQQIIWGGNYFTDNLLPSKGWIFWDKCANSDNLTFSDGELAWTSFNKALKKIAIPWIGFGAINTEGTTKTHPCQKPVKLYEWLLTNYSEPGQRILDTHLGSGSSAIAAHYFGCDFVGMEIDEDYYNAAVKRFEAETAQLDIFG